MNRNVLRGLAAVGLPALALALMVLKPMPTMQMVLVGAFVVAVEIFIVFMFKDVGKGQTIDVVDSESQLEKDKDHHAEKMMKWGQQWATPLMITFSVGALISLGGSGIGEIVTAITTGKIPTDLIQTLAILVIAGMGVVGMDLVMINDSIEIRNSRTNDIPVKRSLLAEVFGFAAIEGATFAYVAWQLDKPAPPITILPGSHWSINFIGLVAWSFIAMRAVGFPLAGIRLATLGKKPIGLVQIAQSQLVVVNDFLEKRLRVHGEKMEVGDLLELSLTWEQVIRAPTHADRVTHMKEAITYYNNKNLPPNGVSAGEPPKELSSSAENPGGAKGELPPPQDRVTVTEVEQKTENDVGDQSVVDQEKTPGEIQAKQDDDAVINVPTDNGTSCQEEVPGTIEESASTPTPDRVFDTGNVRPGPDSLGNSYILPDGLALGTSLTQTQVESIFGITDSSLGRRYGIHATRLNISPIMEGRSKKWAVWMILFMYEQGAFNGLETPKIEAMVDKVIAHNGHH